MLPISENLSNLTKILSIEEEIVLAYLIPSLSTETSRRIRKQEDEVKLQAEINRKLNAHAEMIRMEMEKKKAIEVKDGLIEKHENERKTLMERMLIQLEVDKQRFHQEILMQINDKKNSLNEKLNDITTVIQTIDLYLSLLQEKQLILEKERIETNKQLDAIHFDKPFRIMIDKDSNLYIDADLNEILIQMRKNEDVSIKSKSVIENLLQNKITEKVSEFGKKLDQDKINLYNNFIVSHGEIVTSLIQENNLSATINLVDKDNIQASEIKSIKIERSTFETKKVKLENNANILNKIILSDLSDFPTSQLHQHANEIDILNVKADKIKRENDTIMKEMSQEISEMQNFIKVHNPQEVATTNSLDNAHYDNEHMSRESEEKMKELDELFGIDMDDDEENIDAIENTPMNSFTHELSSTANVSTILLQNPVSNNLQTDSIENTKETFEECDPGLINKMNGDFKKLSLKNTTEGLEYKAINKDGKSVNNLIKWNELPDGFPKKPLDIMKSKEIFLPMLLDQISKTNQTQNKNESHSRQQAEINPSDDRPTITGMKNGHS